MRSCTARAVTPYTPTAAIAAPITASTISSALLNRCGPANRQESLDGRDVVDRLRGIDREHRRADRTVSASGSLAVRTTSDTGDRGTLFWRYEM